MEQIQKIIYNRNPINLHHSKFIKYSSIIYYIYMHISIYKNISEEIINQIFIDNFGDSYIIHNIKNNFNIFKIITNDLISINIL
jgi:hypothetical protein